MGRLDFKAAVMHAPSTAEEAARRRPRGAVAVGVVRAAMTRTHEQAGLREPRHRAAQVGAIDGEHQKLRCVLLVHTKIADVDPRQSGHPVPRLAEWVVKRRQPRFVDRVAVHLVQRDQWTSLLRTPKK